MSEQKLSERMNAEIKELILRGLPVTQSQALDWRDEVAALEAKLETMKQTVDEQAEDEGLWFVAATAPEAYLQQELRQLHAVIEAATQEEKE